MAQGGPTPPTSDLGTTSSAIPHDLPQVLPTTDPIASEWQRLASMDRQSPDFLPLLLTLTAGGNQSPTTKLRGENARIVLSALDEVFRDGRIPSKYERDTRSVMRALAHDSCQVPPRYQVKPDALSVESRVFTSGASSDIRRGRLGEKTVAVKTLKTCGKINPNDARKRFCKECIIWMSVSHPHLLQLIAIDIDPLSGECSMISEMMLNGNIKDYVSRNPENLNRLCLLHEAAMGLHYLHEREIIHGDLKGHNILITDGTPTRACLADFGLSTLTPSAPGEKTTITAGGTPLYMAPELLNPDKYGEKDSRPTKPADVYAFGMVIYEVLTGFDPFYDKNLGTFQLVYRVVGGLRPTKPINAKDIGFGSGTWKLVKECWKEKSKKRPTIERVLAHLAGGTTSSTAVSPTDQPLREGLQIIRRLIRRLRPTSHIGQTSSIVEDVTAAEEAILWLSQVPLDPPETRAIVSSLALISSSRSSNFPNSVIVLLSSSLESSFNKEPSQEDIDNAINCVLVLGRIKFQSVVDRNSDCDHGVRGIPVTALVAWAAQQLTTDAFQAKFDTLHSEGIRAQLLTAAAWLSPAERAEDVEWNGEKLKIQDRFGFIEKIRILLERHARSNNPLEREVIIDLIHGMHASIPRGDYGIVSSIISFLPMLCVDYDSPWLGDEAVFRALITYALDLLLPPEGRKPLVERRIEFEKLASELIDALRITATNVDVVAFTFWLIYRVPYAFKSRKTLLTDIAYIWTLTNTVILEDHRERTNSHAVDAFVAVAQFHATANGELPKFTPHTALELLEAGLGYNFVRAMAIYAIAMILNLGTSKQAATFTSRIAAESFGEALFDVRSDLEENTMGGGAVDLCIYLTLILLKFRAVELDVGKVKTLIGEMDKAIGDSITGGSRVARDSRAEVDPELDRVRWKAIYLSALLFTFVPEDEKQGLREGFRAKVAALLRSGRLPLADDYNHCIEPLAMDVLDLSTPAEKQGPAYAAFDVWIDNFPLFPLAGSVTSVKT